MWLYCFQVIEMLVVTDHAPNEKIRGFLGIFALLTQELSQEDREGTVDRIVTLLIHIVERLGQTPLFHSVNMDSYINWLDCIIASQKKMVCWVYVTYSILFCSWQVYFLVGGGWIGFEWSLKILRKDSIFMYGLDTCMSETLLLYIWIYCISCKMAITLNMGDWHFHALLLVHLLRPKCTLGLRIDIFRVSGSLSID